MPQQYDIPQDFEQAIRQGFKYIELAQRCFGVAIAEQELTPEGKSIQNEVDRFNIYLRRLLENEIESNGWGTWEIHLRRNGFSEILERLDAEK